ncbi:D-alanyl-D-alanine carboxypeptidase family protein [Umezawaea beigongshangensis]|uniref:D-alanyl-D-alanine carboxypeptidase family protein n=1 Tax=Umezawaea beigongshangensis TaxID=2780383 RepID=UPI0027DB65B7|nr:D-alanyl-D-alanine carboxypeptidase family protein [Umezawaea beigongshangensis]
MPSTARRPVVALVLSACTLMATALFAAPVGSAQPTSSSSTQPSGSGRPSAPGTSGADEPDDKTSAPPSSACTNREAPPPAVTESENPAPGERAPAPLPVPEKPLGGDRMGECGLVLPPNSDSPPATVTADSWLLADLTSGAVLAANDPHGRQRPASTTKVLLAVAVARELNPNATVTATQEDVEQECTCIGLRVGGQYTVQELTQALLMASGNDVANALARQLGGQANALRKMNAVAKELGAQDTRAVTPTGLEAPGTSTSAYDVALIFRAAMKFSVISEAFATPRIDFGANSGKGTVPVLNDNRLLESYRGALGGRSGYTDDALHTYVGAAERNGKKLVAVLLRGEAQPLPIADQAAKLLDWGFTIPEADANPVGQLVAGAPQANTNEPQTSTSGAPDDEAGASTASQPTAMNRAFGNVGGPITAVAAVGVLAAMVLALRSRRARAARAKRMAQQQAQF